MADFVKDMYVYDDVICKTEKKTLYCFECLMEVVNTPFGIEVDTGDAVSLPPECLYARMTALIGLLEKFLVL